VDLLVYVVVVSTTTSYVDFYCCSYSLHIYLFPYVVILQPLETWYHSPFGSFAFAFSYVFLVDMTSMVHQHFAFLFILRLALHVVPFSLSFSFWPLPLCFLALFLPLIMRFHLPQLRSSFLEHSLEILHLFFIL